MAFKAFIRKYLEAANTEDEKADMAGLVAQNNRIMGELSDQLSGKKKRGHHHPKDLADALINGIVEITKTRREIEK